MLFIISQNKPVIEAAKVEMYLKPYTSDPTLSVFTINFQ